MAAKKIVAQKCNKKQGVFPHSHSLYPKKTKQKQKQKQKQTKNKKQKNRTALRVLTLRKLRQSSFFLLPKRTLYRGYIVTKWSLDPHSHGAFASFTPYQLSYMWVPLVRPTGNNIFFAGEHTYFIHRSINTATTFIRSSVEAVY